MKQLLFFISILYSFSVFAQKEYQEIDREWSTQINSTFKHLDKSKVPHGILLDYAMEYTDITAYNGKLNDSIQVDANVLGSIYKTLFMGKVTSDTMFFPPIEKVAQNWYNYRNDLNTQEENPVLVLSGLYYQYSRINENALHEDKIMVDNNQYYDNYIGDKWQNLDLQIKSTL